MANAVRVITNAKIHTMASEADMAETMVIDRHGRIAAIGNNDTAAPFVKRGAEVIDLQGQCVLPGFYDCHLHLFWLGANLANVDLSSPPVGTIEDIVALLTSRLNSTPESGCIQGNRYDQNRLAGQNHPDRNDLDRVSTEVPVRIVHTSGHAAVLNSAALRKIGIDRNTPDPIGGEIVRDASGEPTGLLLETASWMDLDRLFPVPTIEEARTALGLANRYLLERGITSAGEANTQPDEISMYADAVFSGALTVRTNLMVNWAAVLARGGAVPGPGDLQPAGMDWHKLHVGQAKLFSDGAITTRTCWLTEAFEGVAEDALYPCGMPLHDPEELTQMIVKAHCAGWQLATHAIGNQAIDLVLFSYAEAQKTKTRHLPGHRIEHCMLLDEGLIRRLRRQNVWSVGQPEFISRLGDAYYTALGSERANRLSPYASLEAAGVAQAFSSDCPVVPGAPLDGIRATVRRATPSGAIVNDTERVSVELAAYNYTAAPAFATRTQRDRGSLEKGKLADFVVLSEDLANMGIAAGEEAVKVRATFIGGDCVYGKDNLL